MGRRKIIGAVAGVVLSLLAAVSRDAFAKPTGREGAGPEGGSSAASFDRYRQDYFDNFYAVASGGAGTLWAVGNSGRIIHSPDGGRTWVVQRSPVGENLNSVAFTDPRNGWACGNAGTIIHTTDGGATWALQKAGTNHPLFRIQFVTNEVGFACGYFGRFFRTVDGGKSWEDRSIGEDVTLRGMHFLDERTGFIAGEFGTILRTDNGGASFTRLAAPEPLTLFAVRFVDRKTGFACGVDGTVLATEDGGRSWRRETSGVGSHLLGLDADGRTVVAVGLRGSVTVRDGRGRWIPVATKTLNWLSGVLVERGGPGYAVGAHGTILLLDEILRGKEK